MCISLNVKLEKEVNMKKQVSKKAEVKEKKEAAISYRIKCKRTANGLSHYVPSEKSSLV